MNDAFLLALSEAGHTEVLGKGDNPEILKYAEALGFSGDWLHDETSWCAASAYWCLKETGYKFKRALNARSFLTDIGEIIQEPELGCIVVFWRGKHKDELISGSQLKKGHVAWYLNTVVKNGVARIVCHGGNQSNKFGQGLYYKSRVLAYIRPVKLNTL